VRKGRESDLLFCYFDTAVRTCFPYKTAQNARDCLFLLERTLCASFHIDWANILLSGGGGRAGIIRTLCENFLL